MFQAVSLQAVDVGLGLLCGKVSSEVRVAGAAARETVIVVVLVELARVKSTCIDAGNWQACGVNNLGVAVDAHATQAQ